MLIKLNEHFKYKGRHCLVFENLHISLQDFMERRRCNPLPVSEIRVIAQQLLVALCGLKSMDLAHCDIKPDKVVLVSKSSLNVKLVDFALACSTSKLKQGLVVQSPSYRDLEVMLGLPFDEGIYCICGV